MFVFLWLALLHQADLHAFDLLSLQRPHGSGVAISMHKSIRFVYVVVLGTLFVQAPIFFVCFLPIWGWPGGPYSDASFLVAGHRSSLYLDFSAQVACCP